MKEIIKSKENKYFKYIKKLKEKKYRDIEKLFIAEGEKLFLENTNYENLIIKESKYNYVKKKYPFINKYIVLSDELFNDISIQNNSQGILIIYKQKKLDIKNIIGDVIVLDEVQDPGNLGTIIRTIVATGYKNLILTKNSVDIYSPKVVRATMGGIFEINCIYKEKEEIIEFLLNEKYNVITTCLDNESINYKDIKLKDKNAYLFGNEGRGISKEFLDISNSKVFIPIYGNIESLNVSIALAVFLYKTKDIK